MSLSINRQLIEMIDQGVAAEVGREIRQHHTSFRRINLGDVPVAREDERLGERVEHDAVRRGKIGDDPIGKEGVATYIKFAERAVPVLIARRVPTQAGVIEGDLSDRRVIAGVCVRLDDGAAESLAEPLQNAHRRLASYVERPAARTPT